MPKGPPPNGTNFTALSPLATPMGPHAFSPKSEVVPPSHRLRADTLLYNNRPFQGEGHSLYVTAGETVLYRRRRIMGGRWIRGASSTFDYGATSVAKTTRVASAASPAATIPYTIPDSLASQEISVDVRHYKDDVECEVEGFRSRAVELDGSKDEVSEIKGSGTQLNIELRSGGTVRLRFLYNPSRDGVQPYLFRASRTAGPTSPTAVTKLYSTATRLYEIDIPTLSDASAYTFTITAENQAGSVTKDIITGWRFTPDASGPPTPKEITIRSW